MGRQTQRQGGACTTTRQTRLVPVKINPAGLRTVGLCLIALGLIVVFVAIPLWIWAVLIGVLLIAVGFVLLSAG